MKRTVITIILLFAALGASAQFRSEAFQQQYNDDKASPKDSVDVLFSFKEYFAGLGHKQEIKIGTMFAGSALVIGGEQIYNKQYWKLPIVYTGIFAPLGAGIYFNKQGKHDIEKYCSIRAGESYWDTIPDGATSSK